MPAVDETEVDIALTKNSLEKNDMVGEEKRKVTNNHLLVTFFFEFMTTDFTPVTKPLV